MIDRRIPGQTATFVTRAEVKAAQMMVRRMRARGEEPSRALLAIANATDGSRVSQPA
ncbi:MAG: hypothetical protein QM714_17335 [Nocardioides sp.]|uniref:hypothetical protein n=1 Tax=Nocardioides sp. TaxID=35761 RepID=UPI0039E3F61B